MAIRQIDETNLDQLNLVDSTFDIDSLLCLRLEDGVISYWVEPAAPRSKTYPPEALDYWMYIGNPDKAIYLAFLDAQVAGQMVLEKWWNGFGYIRDLAVDVSFRRQGIGRRLIEQAVEWAKARGLPGLMLETQNNNVGACLFYESCGFHLGGFDQHLYRAQHRHTNEIALFWYLFF